MKPGCDPSSRRDARPAGKSAVWSPDRGDGTYQNPVLFADYSDPDAIRVGEDYWLTSSSFSHVPGLPILHSRDLVNWTLVNHALPRLRPVGVFSRPRPGQGVWAPTIRHHAGRFWIFFPDPDAGIFVTTADDPRGEWSEPAPVLTGKGLIDPCPFWDENGDGYLIHAWARSRAGFNNRLTLHRLDPASRRVLDAGSTVIDGDRWPGMHTLEGPKLYRRNGYYYIFAPAGGVRDGYQAVFRSRSLPGPYEHRVVLRQGRTAINGPHQGAWVEDVAGGHWFLHFQEIPAQGRVVHLQPLHWRDDGWPVIGHDPDGGGTGEPVLVHAKPAGTPPAGPAETTSPATSDEFETSAPGRQWQWQANPQPGWMSLLAAPGRLRLNCVVAEASDASLWLAPHLLLQKLPAPAFVGTTQVKLSSHQPGESAGLIVFGHDYFWLGLHMTEAGLEFLVRQCRGAHQAGREETCFRLPASRDTAQLRVTVQPGARLQFSIGRGDGEFMRVGPEFVARSSTWVGAKVGLFASAPAGTSSPGHADFDWFRMGALPVDNA